MSTPSAEDDSLEYLFKIRDGIYLWILRDGQGHGSITS